MKVKIDAATAGHLDAVCKHGSQSSFPGKIFISLMAKEELSRIERVLREKRKQKSITLNLSFAQLVCIEAVMQCNLIHPSCIIVREAVINPIIKELLNYK
jgi:hypothetical protein